MPRASGGETTPEPMDAQEQAELRLLRVPEEQIAAAVEARRQAAAQAQAEESSADDDLVLAAHLLPVVKLFDALRTQWRAATGAAVVVRTGLDYGAIPPTARMLGMKKKALTPTMFKHIRWMEDETLTLLASGAGAGA